MTLPSGLTEADLERASAEVYRVFEDRPPAAQMQMNGLLAGELARAALTAALAGRVVVPAEPTPEMLMRDGCTKHHAATEPCVHHRNRRRIWSAMLAAAVEGDA